MWLVSFTLVGIKTKIYQLVEKGSHGKRMNKIFDYFIMTLIQT